jgi:osmotically-inducible protein OsmY
MSKIAILALVLISVWGCNSEDAHDLSRDAGNLAQSATKAAGNAEVVVRVNAQLAQTKGVDVSGLHIENKAGVVTVGGHVRTAEEKALVLKTTESIRGVDKVVDDLRIAKE